MRMPCVWSRPGLIAAVVASGVAIASAEQATMPEVPRADLSKLHPDDFRDDELDVPFYLAHFHRLANSIEASGPNRGFITLPVWRPKKHNRPYNVRVLENYISLAYFYCTDRKWNPYHRHPAVRGRLEALLDFWCRSQNANGWFSEYRPKGWNLPATGFAVMFMGETLRMLHDGPPIDRAIHDRVIAAHRKAIVALLTDAALFNGGKSCSNQYSGLWGGMLAHLEVYPDEKLLALMRKRLVQSLAEHQSPAGYWYENRGCDWPYTLRTHTGNILMAWHYARETDLAELFVRGETRWTVWRAYNAVREPGGAYVLNRAIDSRSRRDFTPRHGPLSEKVILARAFVPTQSEARAASVRKRRQLEKDWPGVPELRVGDHHAYSPHVLLNLKHRRWYPTEAQRGEAVKQLPYLASRSFNHQRGDDHLPQVYTFVRRPAYYAVFNAGKRLHRQQRYGLGLVWTDQGGTLLQSQSASHDGAWGTRAAGSKDVYEVELTGAAFHVAGKTIHPEPGARDLARGQLTISYPLGKTGRKTLTFGEDHIAVDVRHAGAFTEQLPLLLARGAKLRLEKGVAKLNGAGSELTVRAEPAGQVGTKELDAVVAGKRVVALRLQAVDTLSYRIDLAHSQ